jgi:predicted phage-related endonuclease
VERVPQDEILKLLECEKNGEIYQQRALTIPDTQLENLLSLEVIIADCENRKKQAETDIDTIKKALLEEMNKQGIYKFENDNIKITKSDSYIRETIDSKKLKADKPEIYKEYTKITQIKESLRVSLK